MAGMVDKSDHLLYNITSTNSTSPAMSPIVSTTLCILTPSTSAFQHYLLNIQTNMQNLALFIHFRIIYLRLHYLILSRLNIIS